MTGFSAKWHFRDSESNEEIGIDEEKFQFPPDSHNSLYAGFVHMFRYATICKNMSLEDVKRTATAFRSDWTSRESKKKSSQCVDGKVDASLLTEYATSLWELFDSMPFARDESCLQTDVQDDQLKKAYKIYFTAQACPKEDYVAWKILYKDLFEKYSPRMILANIINLVNKHKSNHDKKTVPEVLLARLEDIFNLKHELLDITMMDENESNKAKLGKNEVEDCIKKDNCTNLLSLFHSIGKL